jgi:NTP pyrophosphatase (non-canonical NTP hydrolase)
LQGEIESWLAGVYPDRSQQDVLIKFLEEVAELFKNPNDSEEIADLLILLLDLARFAGVDLLTAGYEKLAINRSRQWQVDPKTGIMHHVPPS